MAIVMLALGDYRFSVDTAAYQNLRRTSQYRWQTQDRLDRRPAEQFVGTGSETIRLPGTIHPHYKGGLGQLPAMRKEAEKGEPLLMVDGMGNNLGLWVITQIEEDQSVFLPEGAPRQIQFTVTVRRYGEDQ